MTPSDRACRNRARPGSPGKGTPGPRSPRTGFRSAGLYVDALTHQTEDPSKMVPLYALGSRMRLVSARAVTDAAIRIDDSILATYMGPNRSLQEVRDLAREGEIKT